MRTQGSTGLIIKGCLFENCTSEAVGVGFGGANSAALSALTDLDANGAETPAAHHTKQRATGEAAAEYALLVSQVSLEQLAQAFPEEAVVPELQYEGERRVARRGAAADDETPESRHGFVREPRPRSTKTTARRSTISARP